MADKPTARPKRRSAIGATLKALVRTRVTTGLLVVLPIYVTILLVTFVFGFMRDSSSWVVDLYLRSPAGYPILEQWKIDKTDPFTGDVIFDDHDQPVKITLTEKLKLLQQRLGRRPEVKEFFEILPPSLQWFVSIASVLLTIFLLYTVGLLAANFVGRRMIETVETVVDKVPLVKTVYRSSKQILATFAGEQGQDFQRVALIPFPQEKMRCVGFITATFKDSVTGEELATVFIPTTPNPTTGYLQICKRADLVELDWTVEDAVRTIMSGGILRPKYLTMVPNAVQDEIAGGPPPAADGGVLRPSS